MSNLLRNRIFRGRQSSPAFSVLATITEEKIMKSSETFLPGFTGFYCTRWEHMIDYSEMCDSQRLALQETGEHALEETDFRGIYNEVTDYGKQFDLLVRRFCELYDEHISKKVGFPVGLKFKELISPEFYNFTTDRILATIPTKSVRALYALSEAGKHKKLEREIIATYTSYDGFFSYYSNDVRQWIAKPVAQWDCNELFSLLAVFVDPEVDEMIFHQFSESEWYNAFETSVNWRKFDRKVAALRKVNAN
jgi:hypothetical protein